MAEQATIPVGVRIDSPEWIAVRTPEGPWVAQCPTLSLAIECDSLEEIQQDAVDAIDLLIADLFETGDWMEFFRERKVPFKFLRFSPTPPAKEEPSYNVPISLVVEEQSHDQPLRDHR